MRSESDWLAPGRPHGAVLAVAMCRARCVDVDTQRRTLGRQRAGDARHGASWPPCNWYQDPALKKTTASTHVMILPPPPRAWRAPPLGTGRTPPRRLMCSTCPNPARGSRWRARADDPGVFHRYRAAQLRDHRATARQGRSPMRRAGRMPVDEAAPQRLDLGARLVTVRRAVQPGDVRPASPAPRPSHGRVPGGPVTSATFPLRLNCSRLPCCVPAH